MAKRFTDTFKWQRPWYRNLPPKYRELWNYILDMCDHAGIWYVDIQMAGLVLNFSDLDLGEARKLYEKQIQVIDESRWFIIDFIPFQYGKLTNSKFHISISTTLKKFKLQLPKGYGIPYQKGTLGTPLVKERERVKEDVKKLEVSKADFEKLWSYYPKKDGKKSALKAFLNTVKTLHDLMRVTAASENYINYIKKNGTEERYIKNGSTFFNNWEDWVNYGTNDGASSVDLKAESRAAREAKRAREESTTGPVSSGVRDAAVFPEGQGRGSPGGTNE